MKAMITVNMDNAAFTGNEGIETARILRELADKIDGEVFEVGYDRKISLRDSNGNTVGVFTVTSED